MNAPAAGRESYDYIVVGAGSAGCVVAHRLADVPGARVLLLEQGPPSTSWKVRIPGAVRECLKPGSPYLGRVSSLPQTGLNDRVFALPYGKGLGGSSLVNGMVYLRGHRADFERWRDLGAAGWGYDDLLPCFKRLETAHCGSASVRGRDGPIGVGRSDDLRVLDRAFLDAGRQAGFPTADDVNGDRPEGFGRFEYNASGGFRSSSAYCYLERRRRRGALTVKTGVTVLGLGCRAARAETVRYLEGGQVRAARAEGEIVISAGALASPKLLLLSGIGPADRLRGLGIAPLVDLPGVGANLHDHVDLDLQWQCKRPVSDATLLKPHNILRAGLRWALAKSGPAAMGPCRVGALLRSNDRVAQPNVELMLFPVAFRGWVPRKDIHGFRISAMQLQSASRGTLRLRSDDPLAAPLVDPNYLAAERDRAELKEAYALVRDLVAQPAFADYLGAALEPEVAPSDQGGVDALIRATANPGYHFCGTCRLGDGADEMAVVAPDARVRGMDNLRVADASIMPSIVSANTNASAMMIGERVSELMLEKPSAPGRARARSGRL